MKAFLLGIIGLMLLLSACVQQPSAPVITEPLVTPPEQNATMEPSAPCQSGSILEKDECYLSLAKAQGKLSWCDKIYSADKKDECIYPFAKVDGELCQKLFSSNLRSTCYLTYAQAKDDVSICDRIGNSTMRLECVKGLSPPCTLEPTDVERARCMAFLKNDYTLCKSTDCFIDYAIARSDAGACDLVPATELPTRLACRAAAKNSAAQCEAANNSVIADLCYYTFAKLSNNASYCSFTSKGSPYGNSCWQYFAIAEMNSSYCKNPTPEPARDECYMNYSVKFDDYSMCEKVVVSINRAKCYIDVARENGNMAACDKLLFGVIDTCGQMVLAGPGVKDPTNCADVTNDLWRDKCYVWSAEHYRDTSLCNFVSLQMNDTCMAPFKYN